MFDGNQFGSDMSDCYFRKIGWTCPIAVFIQQDMFDFKLFLFRNAIRLLIIKYNAGKPLSKNVARAF